MNAIPDYPIFQFALWRSISVATTPLGYAVFEAPDRFWRERMAEAVLRLVGVGLILVGYIQWFLPDTMLHGNPMVARMALSALFMGTGIALYFFASRGFRKEIQFEVVNRQISIGRLNTRNRCLISRQIPMDRIESLFVGRSFENGSLATLNMRLKGFPPTVCVMRGTRSEIEELHSQLCRDIQIACTALEPAPGLPKRMRPVMPAKVQACRPAAVPRPERTGRRALAFSGVATGR